MPTGEIQQVVGDEKLSATSTGNHLLDLPKGLLERAHVVANWPPIYIGKESDKRWEEGEDFSLLEFKAIQYSRTGMVVADDEQLAQIAKIPKRELMRRGINQHTLEKICSQTPVRAAKLAKCLTILQELESEQASSTENNHLM